MIVEFQIADLLKEKSQFDIGFISTAGNSGKKTTIMQSHFDCVLFINDQLPSFEKVIDEFEDILEISEYPIEIHRRTDYVIQFKVRGFEFDFLPAPNFVTKSSQCSSGRIDQQQRATLNQIKADPETLSYKYSTALSQAVLRFMKKQSSFVHEMVRVAKFWFKTLHFKRHISGDKTLIDGGRLCSERGRREFFHSALAVLHEFSEVDRRL